MATVHDDDRPLYEVMPALLRPGGLQALAEAALRRTLAADPHDADAQWKLAEVHRRQGSFGRGARAVPAPGRPRPRPAQGRLAGRGAGRRRAAGNGPGRSLARAVRVDDELSRRRGVRSPVGARAPRKGAFRLRESGDAVLPSAGPRDPHHPGGGRSDRAGFQLLVRPEDSAPRAGGPGAAADGRHRPVRDRDKHARVSHGRVLPAASRYVQPCRSAHQFTEAQLRVFLSPRALALLRRRSAALRYGRRCRRLLLRSLFAARPASQQHRLFPQRLLAPGGPGAVRNGRLRGRQVGRERPRATARPEGPGTRRSNPRSIPPIRGPRCARARSPAPRRKPRARA